jgi:hypothetical protein
MSPPRIELSVDELMAKARGIAGVDMADDEIVEPLTIIHRALNEEAKLDEEGIRAHEAKLIRLLANRLRMKRDFLRHPEILEQPVKGPLIVMGVARSGTTKTQKVLAASGDFNYLPFWQNFNWASFSGESNESPEPRIAEAEEFCRWYDTRSPETKFGHSFRALEPEQESVLGEGCFVSPSFIGYAEMPSYAHWLRKQPPSIGFRFLREVMKYLQWQELANPAKPWLLKSPNYNGLELGILKVFPEARFVMAHRSPLKTLPSMCKLVQCFRAAFGEVPPDHALIMEGNFASMAAHLANRRTHKDLPLLDVRFEDLVKALPETLERIYAHAGMILSEEALQNMLRWNAENTMHQLGDFRYSLEEFGLKEAVIRERMASYFELLDSLAAERLKA